MAEDWRRQLIARHPDLFRRTAGDQEVTTGYPRVGDGWREIVEKAVDLAEARAACTCDVCGRTGRLFDHDGSLATRCEEHGHGKPAPRSGDENTIIKHEIDGTGRLRMMSRRGYDCTRDSFIDIPEEH